MDKALLAALTDLESFQHRNQAHDLLCEMIGGAWRQAHSPSRHISDSAIEWFMSDDLARNGATIPWTFLWACEMLDVSTRTIKRIRAALQNKHEKYIIRRMRSRANYRPHRSARRAA